MTCAPQPYYYVDSEYQLDLNLQEMRYQLIQVLDIFEARGCFVCNSLQCCCPDTSEESELSSTMSQNSELYADAVVPEAKLPTPIGPPSKAAKSAQSSSEHIPVVSAALLYASGRLPYVLSFQESSPVSSTPHMPTPHVPTPHVPTPHVPTSHVPTPHVPTKSAPSMFTKSPAANTLPKPQWGGSSRYPNIDAWVEATTVQKHDRLGELAMDISYMDFLPPPPVWDMMPTCYFAQPIPLLGGGLVDGYAYGYGYYGPHLEYPSPGRLYERRALTRPVQAFFRSFETHNQQLAGIPAMPPLPHTMVDNVYTYQTHMMPQYSASVSNGYYTYFNGF